MSDLAEQIFRERREKYQVEGVVPRLRREAERFDSVLEMKKSMDLSPGSMKLNRWISEGQMPAWWVEHLRSELNGEKPDSEVRVPYECNPKRLAEMKSG